MLNVEYLMKRNNQKPNNYLPITNYKITNNSLAQFIIRNA